MDKNKSLETIAAIVLVGLVAYWFFRIEAILILSLVLLFIALFIPSLSKLISSYWMKLAELIGGVVSKIILSLIFIIVLIPISFLYKLFNRKEDALQLKKKDAGYWKETNTIFTPENFKKIW